MPGLPSAGTTEFINFSISFWAALYSGILYSILTGTIVSVAIWRIQLGSESRQKKYESAKELEYLKSRLKIIAEQPDFIFVNSAEKSMPSLATNIIELLQQYPIRIWSESLHKEITILQLLKDYETIFLKCLSSARNLDSELKCFVRQYNSSMNMISSNDTVAIVYYLGKMFDQDDEKIIPWIGLPINRIPQWVKDLYAEALNNPNLIERKSHYLKIRNELTNKINEIKKDLSASVV